MLKKIIYVLKNIIFAPFILYIYNLVFLPVNMLIPINILTILIVGLLGLPGLVLLVATLNIVF